MVNSLWHSIRRNGLEIFTLDIPLRWSKTVRNTWQRVTMPEIKQSKIKKNKNLIIKNFLSIIFYKISLKIPPKNEGFIDKLLNNKFMQLFILINMNIYIPTTQKPEQKLDSLGFSEGKIPKLPFRRMYLLRVKINWKPQSTLVLLTTMKINRRRNKWLGYAWLGLLKIFIYHGKKSIFNLFYFAE